MKGTFILVCILLLAACTNRPTQNTAYSFLDAYTPLCPPLTRQCVLNYNYKNRYWEQALLGADFVQNQMHGDTIKEYIRIIENDRAYELFTLYCNYNYEFTEFHETRLFISNIIDDKHYYLLSFEIPERRANAIGGLMLLDVDSDGMKDVLVWLGHEGNQGVATHTAFLNRGDTYIETNFYEIPNPSFHATNNHIIGMSRNSGHSHSWFRYIFTDDNFIMTDSFTKKADINTLEIMYIITLRDGSVADEIFFQESDIELIESLFYGEGSYWGFDIEGRRQFLFDLH